MKRLILVAILIPSLAFAAGVMQRDSNRNPFPAIAPTKVATVTTGASAAGVQSGTLSTTTFSRVRIQPAAAVTMKINGTGTAWPIAKDAIHDVAIASSVTSLVFYNASSATGVAVIYQAEE